MSEKVSHGVNRKASSLAAVNSDTGGHSPGPGAYRGLVQMPLKLALGSPRMFRYPLRESKCRGPELVQERWSLVCGCSSLLTLKSLNCA